MEQKISENKILNDKTSENRISEGRVVMTDPKKADSFYEESIKTLRTNLQFTGRGIYTYIYSAAIPMRERVILSFSSRGKSGTWESAYCFWMLTFVNPPLSAVIR